MSLAQGVTTNDESSSLLIVHTHTAKSSTDIKSRSLGVRASIRTLGVNVNETKVRSTKRLLELIGTLINVCATIVANVVTLGDKGGLGTPVDGLIGLPGVSTTTGETEGLEAAVLEGDVAGEDNQVSPRDLAAILLLDRPCDLLDFGGLCDGCVTYRADDGPCPGSGCRASCREERIVVDPGDVSKTVENMAFRSLLTIPEPPRPSIAR